MPTLNECRHEDDHIQQLLDEAGQQYERYLRLAQLTQIAKVAASSTEPDNTFRPASLALVVRTREV